MELTFKILGSSSSGNCALLRTNQCKVLIDAGFSARRLEQMLAAEGESLQSIDAVFLTHEHGDHAAGIRGIARSTDIPIFANRDTAETVQAKLSCRAQWKIFENGRSFRFHDIEVSPFSVPHDAYDPVGYVFESGSGSLFDPYKSLAWVTDLGYLPNLVRQRVSQVDLLVLEANYDPKMLEEDTRRPWSTKQRIRGRHGHLSNEAAFEFLAETERPRWQQVCLGHLSKDCNSVAKVEAQFQQLHQHGKNFTVDVIDPESCEAFAYTF